jgi:Coenzyme PQQ synthesis protein D (PqqD)
MDSDRFRASPAVRASVSDDGLVLLDVRRGLVLASNPIGARIWQLIEERRTTAEIARQLVDDYRVPSDRARRDVSTFIAALVGRGLLTAEAPC